MKVSEREHLKKKIEADLELLIAESWDSNVINDLQIIYEDLQSINLEGYDD